MYEMYMQSLNHTYNASNIPRSVIGGMKVIKLLFNSDIQTFSEKFKA